MARAIEGTRHVGASEALLIDLEDAVRATRRVFGAAACSCALTTEVGDELQFVVASGVGAEAIVGIRLPVNRGIAGWTATSGEPIAVVDVGRDSRFAREVAESTEYVPRTVLAAPLMSRDGEVAGVVEVLDPDAHRDPDHREQRGTGAELALLTLVSSQLAAVVRLHRELGSVVTGPQVGAADPGTGDLAEAVRLIAGSGPAAARLTHAVLAAVATYLDDSPR